MSADQRGIYVNRDFWRKPPIFVLHSPIIVLTRGLCHHMEFCSEYLDKNGSIVSKNAAFCLMVQEFLQFAKNRLKVK
jgi:hypothetical protein